MVIRSWVLTMSVTTRRTKGSDRLASANLNFLGDREGETDLGVMNCGPAIEKDRLSLLGDWVLPRASWLARVGDTRYLRL